MCIFQYPKFSCGCFSFPEPYYRCSGANFRAKTKVPIVCKVEGKFIPVIKTILLVPGECHECRSQREKIREEMLNLDPAAIVKAHHEAALRRLEGRSVFHDEDLDTDNGRKTPPYERRWSWDFTDEEQFTVRNLTTPVERQWSWDFGDEEQFTVRKPPTPPQKRILAWDISDEAVSLVEVSNGKNCGKRRLNMEKVSDFAAQAAKRNERG